MKNCVLQDLIKFIVKSFTNLQILWKCYASNYIIVCEDN